MRITAEARARYELHRRARRRILTDLGMPDGKLNQKLTAWWELDFPAFRAEIPKVFKRDIPLKDRDDWEECSGPATPSTAPAPRRSCAWGPT